MKKLISFLCALVLTFSLSVPTLAVEANINDTYLISEIESFISDSILPYHDIYDASSKTTLEIGKEIPAYLKNSSTEAVEEAPVHYYPIISDSLIIGIVQMYNDTEGNRIFYYSEAYADTLNTFVSEHGAVALIGDGQSLTLLSQNAALSLSDKSAPICTFSASLDITFETPTSELHALDLSVGAATRAPDGYNISVPKKKQTENWDCWAACVASVGQYRTGINYAPITVANLVDINTYADMDETKSALSSVFSVSSTYYSGSPQTNELINYIYADKPVLGGFVTTLTNVGHMVVICGYGSSAYHFSIVIMDPDDGQYATLTTSSDNPITIPLGGVTYALNEYLVA